MDPNQDPLDKAIGLLKTRSQGHVPANHDLEQLVMRAPMKATSVKTSVFVKAILAVFACAAIGCGVVIAAGGVQQISEYFGFPVRVEFTKADGENVTVEGTLDGNQLLDEEGQVIPELSDVRAEHIEGTDVFITRGRKEDVEKITSIEELAGGNQEGSVLNEDGEVARAKSSSLEIPATLEPLLVMRALIKLNAARAKELEPGQRVDVRVDAYPDQSFKGTLTTILNEKDSAENALVWILIDNTKDITLRAGMTAVVTIELDR